MHALVCISAYISLTVEFHQVPTTSENPVQDNNIIINLENLSRL